MRQRTQARLRDRKQEGYTNKLLAKKLGYKQPLSITKMCKKMDNKQARKVQEKALERGEQFGDDLVDMCRK